MLKIGDNAPSFCASNQDDVEICSRDLTGKWLVLYFYPKDLTPGCTTQACDFTNMHSFFDEIDAMIIGISPDSTSLHRKFIDKHDLTITLLSDETKQISKDFQVWQLKKFMGKEFMGIVRTTFIIDPSGKIAYIWDKVSVRSKKSINGEKVEILHVEQVRKKLQELQKKFRINMKKIFKNILTIVAILLYTNNAMAEQAKNSKLNFKAIGIQIDNIDNNKSTIKIGNLIMGQTGIVVHTYEDKKRIIVSNAKVISSNDKISTIEFFNFDGLKQDSIPTTKRKVEINDIFVLNYMYDESLLIAPDYDSFQAIKSNFTQNNFIHPDIFAAKLKIEGQPFPKITDIQNFAISENIGTIFFLIDKKIYILDAKTFQILDTYDFQIDVQNKQMPFFSRIEDIKANPFNLVARFSGNDKLGYDNYYKKILGLDND